MPPPGARECSATRRGPLFQARPSLTPSVSPARLAPQRWKDGREPESERTDDDDKPTITDHRGQRPGMAGVPAWDQLQDPLAGSGHEAARPDDALRARRGASRPPARR